MKQEYKDLRRKSVLKYYEIHGRKGSLSKNGYIVITIERKRYYLHRMIWEQNFGKIPKGYQVHHKDENKTNNDINNLVLISKVEHARLHAKKNNLGKNRIGIPPTNKTNEEIIKKIRTLREQGYKLYEIQKVVKLSYPVVQKYAKGDN